MKKSKVHLISHTHWDAEWYFTTNDTTVLLVQNVRDTLKKIKNNNYPFHWDGQTYAAVEYLKMENNKEFKEAIENKKILVGPWYSQSNAIQINGETYFRNLEHGINIAKKLGHSMQHGMMSDIFGFAEQVPQVLEKNGVENAIFMRGWRDEFTNGINEFNWESPSGHSVFAKSLHMGYGNAKFLSDDMEEVKNNFMKIKNDDIEKTVSKNSLLFHGGDQMYMRSGMEDIVKKINSIDDASEWKMSSLDDYMKSVREDLNGKELPIFKGELKAPIGQRIHLTAYSQRQDINELIADLEYKLVYRVEPLNLMSKLNGYEDYNSIIYKTWQDLFLSTAHDAAAGCNSDETNTAIFQRLTEAEQRIDSLENLIKRNLISSNKFNDDDFIIFNTTAQKNDLTLDVEIVTSKKSFKILNDNVDYLIYNSSKESKGKIIKTTPEGEKEISLGDYYLHNVKIFVKNPKPMSYIKLDIEEIDTPIENKTNIKVPNLKLRYEANDGDSYDFSPDKDDYVDVKNIDFNIESAHSNNNIEYAHLKFEHNVYTDFLNRNKEIKQKYDLYMTKWSNGNIDLQFKLDNKMKNVRVSIVVESEKNIDTTIAKTMFYETEYKNKAIEPNWDEIYRECPVNAFPFVGYIKANEINVASKSLREYDYFDNQLNIVAFRSNGWLGKDNLKWRPGRASGVNDRMIACEDGQMQKEVTFDLSLISNNLKQDLIQYLTKVPTYQKQTSAKHIERIQRFWFPETTGEVNDLVFDIPNDLEVTALFSNEDGKNVVRLLNNSNEHKTSELLLNGKKVKEEFKPWEIQTLTF
ncbi:MAG: hypothetical protein NC236_01730 [Mycoplasma sp.]|nr:hypothetical protein [Mycoplasma sp.]